MRGRGGGGGQRGNMGRGGFGEFGGLAWQFQRDVSDEEDVNAVNVNLIRRVYAIAEPYKVKIFLLLVTIIVGTGLSMVPPYLIRAIIDDAIGDESLKQLNILAPFLVVVPLIQGLVSVFNTHLSAGVGANITADLRELLFLHFQRLGIGFYTHTKTGEITARLQNDVRGAQSAITSTFINVITNTITVLFAIGLLFSVDIRLTLCSLSVIPLFFIPARIVGGKIRTLTEAVLNAYSELSSYMTEILTRDGILLMRLFGRKEKNSEDFVEKNSELREAAVKSRMIGAWFSMALGLISSVGTAVVYWYGGYLVIEGEMTVGTIVAFAAYLRMLYTPLAQLMNSRVDIISSLVSFERVFEVLDLPIDVVEREDADNIVSFRGDVRFENVFFSYTGPPKEKNEEEKRKEKKEEKEGEEGDVVVEMEDKAAEEDEEEDDDSAKLVKKEEEPSSSSSSSPSSSSSSSSSGGIVRLKSKKRGMWFNAKMRDKSGKLEDFSVDHLQFKWSLKDISFEVKAGTTAALVGPSGAGKSTLLSLIPRLYDPTKGRILVDERELTSLTFASVARAVGMVSQDTFLFNDTIRNNLLYASPNATQLDLIQACDAAHILDVILSWPDQWDTIVGERGYRLSGGEKQRISIARVILQNPRIILLDEATSSLDSKSEEAIQTALQSLYDKKQHTFLVIAHRLSTILSADQILVIDGGSVLERGTHQELLANKEGLYTSLYNTQFKHKEKEEEKEKEKQKEEKE